MTETDLAAAVRAAVDQWMQATPPAQQLAELAEPAGLSAKLAAAAAPTLILAGFTAAGVRQFVLAAAFRHLHDAFDATAILDTPLGFFPVPDTVGTVGGRAAALTVHGLLQMETVSYRTENDGHLFVNLVSMPGAGRFAEKSKKSMRGHTDGVSFPFNGEDDAENPRIAPSPDLVTLVGLRNPDEVPTRLMPLKDILAQMAPEDVEELKKAQYSISSQTTFVPGMKRLLGKEHVAFDEPVLKDGANGTYVRYSHTKVIPPDEDGAAQRASNSLEAACNQVAQAVVVRPGDLLIISNRLGLHGRGSVGDEVGGKSRWILRTYGLETSNLDPNKRHLGGAPQHVLFP